MPKFKTHLFTRMTGAVKNLYGTVHGMMKVAYHTRYRNPEDFSAMLLDLADYLQPRFTLVDAVIGMEGDGPTWGSSRTIGFVVAGVNPLAVDWVLSQMMGFSPNDVPLFRVMAPPEIEVLGTPLRPGILRGFRLPQPNPFPDGLEGLRWMPERMRNGLGRELLLRPHVISESCARCALCVERCPEGAIRLTDEGAFVDYRRCIGCWCCTEVCPTGAVIPRRSLVGRILSKVL